MWIYISITICDLKRNSLINVFILRRSHSFREVLSNLKKSKVLSSEVNFDVKMSIESKQSDQFVRSIFRAEKIPPCLQLKCYWETVTFEWTHSCQIGQIHFCLKPLNYKIVYSSKFNVVSSFLFRQKIVDKLVRVLFFWQELHWNLFPQPKTRKPQICNMQI